MARLRHILAVVHLGLVFLGSLAGVAYASLPAGNGFSDEVVFTNLTLPTAVRFTQSGQAYVAEQEGVLKFYPDTDTDSPSIVINLTSEVDGRNDRGLLGLAVDPNYTTNRPYVYVLYTMRGPLYGDERGFSDGFPGGRLQRLTVDNSTGELVDNETIFTEWCQMSKTHTVGDLVFGPDGYLYISGGEGASDELSYNESDGSYWPDYGQFFAGGNLTVLDEDEGGELENETFTDLESTCPHPPFEGGALRAQDINDLHPGRNYTALNGSNYTYNVTANGKILRVDPDTGLGVPTNPLYGDPDTAAGRVVAQGMRNPFRLAIDNMTGEVYVANTGFYSYDELEYIATDALDLGISNYGWPCYEGAERQNDWNRTTYLLNLTLCRTFYDAEDNGTALGGTNDPLYAFPHIEGAPGSASGVLLYRGSAYPSRYYGALFYADYIKQYLGESSIVVFPRNLTGNLTADDLPGLGDELPALATDQVPVNFSGSNGAVDLQVGPGGFIYYADLCRLDEPCTNVSNAVHRIVYDAPNVVAVTVTSSVSPIVFTFNGSSVTTPFTTNATEYESITMVAPSTVSVSGVSYGFDEWSDGSTVRTRTFTINATDLTVEITFARASSGGGGGGGGGFVGSTAGEKTITFTTLQEGVEKSMSIATDGVPLTTLTITPGETLSSKSTVTVRAVRSTDAPTGLALAYQYFSITVPDALKDAKGVLTVEVPLTWLTEHDLKAADVVVWRRADGSSSWQSLATKQVASQDVTKLRFEATTPGFSVFAVGSVRHAEQAPAEADGSAGAQPTDASVQQVAPPEEPSVPEAGAAAPAGSATQGPARSVGVVVTVVGVLLAALLAAVYVHRRSRKRSR